MTQEGDYIPLTDEEIKERQEWRAKDSAGGWPKDADPADEAEKAEEKEANKPW